MALDESSFDKNTLEDAEREYQENIRKNSKTDANGSLKNSLNPVQNRAYKVAMFERSIISTTAFTAYSLVGGDTATKQGLDTVVAVSVPTALLITTTAKTYMARQLENELVENVIPVCDKLGINVKNAYTPRGRRDLDAMADPINRYLANNNLGKATGSGRHMQVTIGKMNFRAGSNPMVREALGAQRRIAMAKTMRDSNAMGYRKMSRYMFSKFRRYLSQTETGQGFAFISNIIRRSRITLISGLRLIHTAAQTAALTVKLAYKTAAWAAVETAKKTADLISLTEPGKEVVGRAREVTSEVSKANKQVKNTLGKARNKFSDRMARFRAWARDPFRIHAGFHKFGSFIGNTKAGRAVKSAFRVLNLPGTLLAKALAPIIALVSALINTLLVMGLVVVVVMIIIATFTAMIFSIIRLFDFSLTDEEIRDAALNEVRTCYESTTRELTSLDAHYRNVSITYRDVRDADAYNERGHQTVDGFEETTNSAEIMCMAMVNFDFDLEEAGRDRVLTYVRQLYNGSHITQVVERPHYAVNDEGERYIDYTDATVTITTYYFNSIFDCQLTDRTSGGFGTISGNDITEQVFNYLTSAGFTDEAAAAVMGNMYQESGVDPTCIQNNGAGPAAGILQWEDINEQNGRWRDLAVYAASRGTDWRDLQTQLDFIIMEMDGEFNTYTGRNPHVYDTGAQAWWPDPVSASQFMAMRDIDLATRIWEQVFTRASRPNMERRIAAAHTFYDTYHNSVPSGNEGGSISRVAASQIGNSGGETYWRWYGFDSHVNWCACFVSWCADQCGYISQGVVPRFSACSDGAAWFMNRGQYLERGATPSPGDIIFFNWNGGGIDHVGIVESVSNGHVNTIEGNNNDSVNRGSYSLDDSRINGYGVVVR